MQHRPNPMERRAIPSFAPIGDFELEGVPDDD